MKYYTIERHSLIWFNHFTENESSTREPHTENPVESVQSSKVKKDALGMEGQDAIYPLERKVCIFPCVGPVKCYMLCISMFVSFSGPVLC